MGHPRDQWVVIADFEEVPASHAGPLIRLPRCGNCYELVHRYDAGRAFCTDAPGAYRRMDAETAARWDEAEREDMATRKVENR